MHISLLLLSAGTDIIFEVTFFKSNDKIQTKHIDKRIRERKQSTNRGRMGFKLSIVLLHFLMITVPIGHHSERLFSVRASNIDLNETQSKIRKIATITTATATIVSDTCNDRFCYSPTNETAIGRETMPSYKEYDQLKTTSILYGLAKMATERGQQHQCARDLKKIYDGIHRKEIWAIKGRYPIQL